MQSSTSSSDLALIQEEPKLLGVRMNFGCSACWIRMPIGGIAQCGEDSSPPSLEAGTWTHI